MTFPAAGWLIAAFLLGSVPTGFLLVRARTGTDVRDSGSGNPGATNVARQLGLFWGGVTLVADAGKGLAAAAAGTYLIGAGMTGPTLAGAAAVLGHVYSPWLRFRGGKGVATAAGACGWLAPLPLAGSIVVFLLSLVATRRVSVGSMAAATAFPVAAWLAGSPTPVVTLGILLAVGVVFWHRNNVARLVRGEEPRWTGRSRGTGRGADR